MEYIEAPSEIEQMILLAVLHLGDEAYGVPVRAAIEKRAGRSISMAAIYGALDRLEGRGHVESWLSEPLPERGGRARRYFRVTSAGARVLRDARDRMARMWRGLDKHPDLQAGR